MNQTPVSLLERLRQPADAQAWTRFVALYAPLIYRWGRRVGLQEQDAADLVQDVLLTLVRTLPSFTYDRHKSFRAWLRTITLNKWRDRRKQRSAQTVPGSPEILDELPGRNDPDEFAETEFRRHVLRRAVQLMQTDFHPTTWKACWEHGVCGRPAPEVAKELNLSATAVYAATFRVLDRLRQELAHMWE